MKKNLKILLITILAFTIFSSINVSFTYAATEKPPEKNGQTIIPKPTKECKDLNLINKDGTPNTKYFTKVEAIKNAGPGKQLGCKIKTGTIQLDDVPFVIKELIEFLISLAGIICMFFIVLGGYFYVFGALTEDKDKGKKTIIHATTGLMIASLAWIIVNVVMYAITQ